MKPVCVPCQRFFRVEKNGYYFIEGMPQTKHALPGIVDATSWTPYKVWVGDRWRCEGCGASIVVGVGSQPLAEHYQPDFTTVVQRVQADQLQVNDC